MSTADSATLQLVLGPGQPGWLAAVLADFDGFLTDHASCEKKASGMALNMASHYPDRPHLLQAMADLAVEEISHYREVIRLLLQRGVAPRADVRDPYVNGMNGCIRSGSELYLLDRLLVAAVIEARGHERFAQIADAVQEPALAQFYRGIAASERRHWQLFTGLACQYYPASPLQERLDELCRFESDLLSSLPAQAVLH